MPTQAKTNKFFEVLGTPSDKSFLISLRIPVMTIMALSYDKQKVIHAPAVNASTDFIIFVIFCYGYLLKLRLCLLIGKASLMI